MLRSSALLLLLSWLCACGTLPTQTGTETQTVNVVEAAALRDTTSIVLAERDLASGTYVTRETVSDAATIQAIIASLDVPLPLRSRLRCPEQFMIRFQLGNGTTQEFGYTCQDGGALLRGEQEFWRGQEVLPPERLRELLRTASPT